MSGLSAQLTGYRKCFIIITRLEIAPNEQTIKAGIHHHIESSKTNLHDLLPIKAHEIKVAPIIIVKYNRIGFIINAPF